MPANDSFGAAAYALVVATILDLAESGRLEAAERVAATAEGVLDGLAEAGSIDRDAREQARAAINSFRQQVGSVDELKQ